MKTPRPMPVTAVDEIEHRVAALRRFSTQDIEQAEQLEKDAAVLRETAAARSTRADELEAIAQREKERA